MNLEKMSGLEQRAALSLAAIFAFRMIGLFIILPVFSLYTTTLKDATPTLIGLALGVYGLTQAALQIPFGMCSDRIGRKPVIFIGLVIFAIGSIIAAQSSTITGIIIGRALQGSGAIGSTVIALLADLTREQNRTKGMAVIGLTIGLAFAAAMVIGPIANAYIGLTGIFWLTALMAVSGIIILFTLVPNPQHLTHQRDAIPIPTLFKKILKDKELLRLDFGILALHTILTASFVAIPISLQDGIGLIEKHQWYVYLPVLVCSFIATIPFIIISEKKRLIKPILLVAIIALSLAEFILWQYHASLFEFTASLIVFFTAFTYLEASLPSLISKRANPGSKGTAMGIYSTSQYFGTFLGGSAGGWLYGHHHLVTVYFACATIALIWLVVAFKMEKPRHLATEIIHVGKLDPSQATLLMEKLLQIPGVAEALVIAEDNIAYLKFDAAILDRNQLTPFLR